MTTRWSHLSAPADLALVRRLERASLLAVPAESEWEVGGWVCRWGAGGLVGRVASACVSPEADAAALAPADDVASAYAARGLPPLLRLTPLAPARLLAAPGLRETRGSVSVMVRGLREPVRAPAAGDAAAAVDGPASDGTGDTGAALDVRLHEHAPPAWSAGFLAHHSRAEGAARLALAAAAPAPRRFAVAAVDGAVAGLGLGVVVDGALGVFDVLTVTEQRRRGVASAVVRSLLAWGRGSGADVAYLQVASANAPAVALYERFGFRPAYAYAYATVSSAGSRSGSPA